MNGSPLSRNSFLVVFGGIAVLVIATYALNSILEFKISKSGLELRAREIEQDRVDVKDVHWDRLHTLIRIDRTSQKAFYYDGEDGGWIEIGETGFISVPTATKHKKSVEQYRTQQAFFECIKTISWEACMETYYPEQAKGPAESSNDSKGQTK